MADLNLRLSRNFTLGELLRSATAERQEEMRNQQLNPEVYEADKNIIENLRYLCTTTLQPIRDQLGVPLRITSGYRSPLLNAAVGGSKRSQHCFGMAADVQLSSAFLTHPKTRKIRRKIEKNILHHTGKPIKAEVNANFYLFAYICLRLNQLDIDQVIHEYGEAKGRPAWVHIAASNVKNKREILGIGRYFDGGKDKPELITALKYGV